MTLPHSGHCNKCEKLECCHIQEKEISNHSFELLLFEFTQPIMLHCNTILSSNLEGNITLSFLAHPIPCEEKESLISYELNLSDPPHC